ncbi:cell cycle regulator of non-homologous end joining [Colius striatus]|uniref:cell cycle regulator of non-homologous end joining n=1 Tax=Colius striatus TaxID=57412 RepID=UPI002B1E259D|nr:cell cycle regulator of non-homologous end joining [Colius striatus]
MAASPRRRRLPAWMGGAAAERAAAEPPAAGRRAAGRPRATAVRYCMSEAELVDVAVAVLSEKLRCEEGDKKPPSGSEEEQELQPTPQEAPGSTASTGGGSDRSPAFSSPPDAGAGVNAERTGWEDSEDDILKYVREIFFR